MSNYKYIWDELKETIHELHEANTDKPDVENVTRFLENLMNVKEKKNTDIRDCAAMWCDDISFCGEECDWLDCPRNSKNIRDKTVPHSYIVGTPDDCPKKLEGAVSAG